MDFFHTYALRFSPVYFAAVSTVNELERKTKKKKMYLERITFLRHCVSYLFDPWTCPLSNCSLTCLTLSHKDGSNGTELSLNSSLSDFDCVFSGFGVVLRLYLFLERQNSFIFAWSIAERITLLFWSIPGWQMKLRTRSRSPHLKKLIINMLVFRYILQ